LFKQDLLRQLHPLQDFGRASLPLFPDTYFTMCPLPAIVVVAYGVSFLNSRMLPAHFTPLLDLLDHPQVVTHFRVHLMMLTMIRVPMLFLMYTAMSIASVIESQRIQGCPSYWHHMHFVVNEAALKYSLFAWVVMLNRGASKMTATNEAFAFDSLAKDHKISPSYVDREISLLSLDGFDWKTQIKNNALAVALANSTVAL
jgi:hypothetical protein